MDSEIIESVSGWETRSVRAGYAGLTALADDAFSGAVDADGTWMFLLNGRVIGVFEGSMADVEQADLTAYVAPDESLPLLYAMQARGGRKRAEYYTNETPLSEADETLSEGGFTGYVELSENVLSGEYYVVYYGGRSLSVAFVGSSGTLHTGEDAFQRANDEVGIYEVYDADIEVTEIPEPESEPEPEAERSSDPAPDRNPESADAADERDAAAVDADGAERRSDAPASDDPPESRADPAPASDSETSPPTTAGDDAEDASPTTTTGEAPESESGDAVDETVAGDAPDPETREGGATDGEAAGEEPVEDAGPDRAESGDGAAASAGSVAVEREASDDRFTEEQRWRESRIIPSLAPDEASEDETRGRRAPDESRPRQRGRANDGDAPDAEAELESTRTELAELRAERDRLADEFDEAQAELERLRERVETLEAERDRLESDLASASNASASREGADAREAGSTMAVGEALDGTNLFVRYRSKSGPTLEEAYSGRATRDEVNENLRIEHHTSFETADLTVEGRPFEEFLHDTVEYRFVRWLVEELLYEIGETGNERSLDELYSAIPRIDRAELQGVVDLDYEVDGEETHEEQTFDVVLRDRMGDPLVVADLNDARDPATGEMMRWLVENAKRLGETTDSLGAAFLVTTSFFEPDALDVAADETGSGIFSRGKHKSYVKLSRKRGFHLSLVEARSDEFHVNVPEL